VTGSPGVLYYKLIAVLPLVMHGRETSTVTIREEHRLRISESRMLKKIFGPKSHEMTGGWRILHNELHNL
jgi:hypothetical protein